MVGTYDLSPIGDVIAAYFFIANNEIFSDKLFGKLDANNESGSTIARISSVFVPLKIAINHPIFGCGIENFKDEYMVASRELFHIAIDPQGSSTNTYTNMCALFGFWFGLWGLYCVYMFVRKYKKGFVGLVAFLAFLFIYSNESLVYNIIFYIPIFYYLSRQPAAPITQIQNDNGKV